MKALPNVAQVGALIGDPARAAMLGALMDGSERPAGELAALSGIAPQTASAHLARLLDGGLLAVSHRGRHRYYRLRDSEVAHAIETLTVAADLSHSRKRRIDPALRRARRCYDHVAGELGVAICDALVSNGRVVAGGDGYALSDKGRTWLAALGLGSPTVGGRPLVRPCLDWTERRPHIAGWLGAALCTRLEAAGAIRRQRETRVLVVTPKARDLLWEEVGLDWNLP
ncbi:MAG: metalloregulator ArsR/SmtB family transcription factor [Alphaproteobacteria bacterium]|nr:metalloregulator ArsR/SmtB family transcription factor [Alphaproteobacteria bacterium]MBL7098570.1 metalloregulator ArsR/SmtB family transcription factor [Alphaproteobacteria bacterium]